VAGLVVEAVSGQLLHVVGPGGRSRGEGYGAEARAHDQRVGSGVVALRRTVPGTRRRIAGDRVEQAAFRYTAATGGGPVGEIVRFEEANGHVVRMYTGDGYVERVP